MYTSYSTDPTPIQFHASSLMKRRRISDQSETRPAKKTSQIDLSSYSKKILVSEDKLYSKLQAGSLLEYIQAKEKKYGVVLAKSAADYQEIITHYQKVKSGELISSHISMFSIDLPLNQNLLMKIIRKSNLILKDKKPSSVVEFQMDNWKLAAFRDHHDKITIIKFEGTCVTNEHSTFLGQGAYGIIQKISNLSKAQEQALKVAKTEKGNESVVSEVDKLMLINPQGKFAGLQAIKSPLLSFEGDISGYLSKYYNKKSLSDVSEILKNLTKKELLNGALALMRGLNEIHKKDVIHGDIKPENCFFHSAKIDDEKVYEFVIGDVGGAKTKDELRSGTHFLGTPHTFGYFTGEEAALLNMQRKKSNLFDDWFDLNKKRDVFALASTLFSLFTQETPYTLIKQKKASYPKELKKDAVNLLHKKIGHSLSQLLIKALDKSPYQRPSLDALVAAFEKELRNCT